MKKAYLDSTQIHSSTSRIGFYIRPEIHGLEMPELRLSSHQRPNVDGGFVSSHLYGMRLISFNGSVIGDSVSQYRERRRTINSVFKIRRSGDDSISRTFKFTTDDDLSLQCEVYTQNFEFPDVLMTSGVYQAHLLSPTHELFSQTEKTATIYIFSGGGASVPAEEIPQDWSVGGTIEQTVTNAGDINAHPTIRLYGPLTNATITNVTNDDQMNVTMTINSGERVEIDTDNRTALHYLSSTDTNPSNVLGNISGDFLRLASGENVVRLTDSSGSSTGFIILNWRDVYSGV